MLRENRNRISKIIALCLSLGVFFLESYGKASSESDFGSQRTEMAKITQYISLVRPGLEREERETLSLSILSASRMLQFPKRSEFAGENEIDKVAFLLGVIQTESQFKRTAKSHKGALGYMQIMPATAKWLSKTKGIAYSDKNELFHATTNLKLGVLFLNDLMKETGSPKDALLAYNAGLGGWKKWGGLPSYPRSIANHYQTWKEFETTGSLSYDLALFEEE
ncbi:transglycosylase SLT domain-containing protein [Leptospira ilyithenensis]|uniref:Lytic transglycosylase domain-containing protein n=1 Tax=Leptospira ilyithenensis TaxID=2484901 RepID=A0A4R9LQJ7_9LEPT|nr:transglycosylase SLT domain-containing protein [Leptospira ilyithenensis]TGN10507.1 lytic transglycosylase domain-containing protein [Leptospira ilyithenensis]